jgi:hypothetical protein
MTLASYALARDNRNLAALPRRVTLRRKIFAGASDSEYKILTADAEAAKKFEVAAKLVGSRNSKKKGGTEVPPCFATTRSLS